MVQFEFSSRSCLARYYNWIIVGSYVKTASLDPMCERHSIWPLLQIYRHNKFMIYVEWCLRRCVFCWYLFDCLFVRMLLFVLWLFNWKQESMRTIGSQKFHRFESFICDELIDLEMMFLSSTLDGRSLYGQSANNNSYFYGIEPKLIDQENKKRKENIFVWWTLCYWSWYTVSDKVTTI